MYDAGDDHYCYPGTKVLKNLQEFRKQAELDQFELAMTTQRLDEPLPAGRFSVTHYCNVHKHIFQDVYAWAGQIRTIRISKAESSFCYPEYIHAQLQKLFLALKQDNYLQGLGREAFCRKAASFLATLNAIHPFRDGNGRSQMAFMALLAHTAGHPLTLTRIRPRRFLKAMIASFGGNEEPLVNEFFLLSK